MIVRNFCRKWAEPAGPSFHGRAGTLVVALLLLFPLLAAACGNGDAQDAPGLSRAEVQELARAEVAASAPEPGLTSADVEQAISAALAAQPGLSRSEAEAIAQAAVASLPQPQPGMSRSEAEAMVQAAVAALPEPQPGISRSEVEAMIQAAVAALPEPSAGLSADDAERIARNAVASIPPRSAPADYTRYFVGNAISRYEAEGLEATLAHYNSPRSVDGQWYVFIIDENDLVIGHPDPERLGLDLKGWVGTDANGYNFGPEMLAATEEGKWVSYVYRNPESGGIGAGDFELKNAWVIKRDGMLFGSGWYIDADEFTQLLVSVAVDKYQDVGLAGTMAYFASPGSALAGLEEALAYYNTAETVDGHWFAFIGGPDGKIVGHSDFSMIGGDVQELLGGETFQATEAGVWVESESLRVFVAGYDGYLFGSGWSQDE